MGLNQFAVTSPHSWAGRISENRIDTIHKSAQGKTRCPAPWSSLSILWDGRVVPCCFDVNADYVVGDISRNTLQEIWNGRPMRQLRLGFAGRKAPAGPPCSSCHIPHDAAILGAPRKTWVELFDMARIRLSQLRQIRRGGN